MADQVAATTPPVFAVQAPTQQQATAPQPDERLDRLEKLLGGLVSKFDAYTRPPEPKNPEAELTLKSMKADLDARDARSKDKAIRSTIDAWCRDSGITEDARPFVKAYIREQFGDKLTVNDNDAVQWVDEFGSAQDFNSLGKKILASQGGKNLLPPIQTPGSVGGRSAAVGVTAEAAKPIHQWTAEEMQKDPQGSIAALAQAYRLRQAQG